MSLKKFELTEDHIKLVRQLALENVNIDTDVEQPSIQYKRPFGSVDIYEDMYLILHGKPEVENLDANPWDEVEKPWTDEELEHMKKLLGELSVATDIILYTGKFEVGTYATKTYMRDWKLKK